MDRVAAARAPDVGLVVRPERPVVLHEVRVVDGLHGVRRHGLARDDGRVVPVGRRLARGVAAPVAELLGPACGVGVVGGPGEAGREGLRVDADLLLRGVALVLARRPVGGPRPRERVLAEVEVGGVLRLARRDGGEVGLRRRVELVPQQRPRREEVGLERRVPEQLLAPRACGVDEAVGRRVVPDRRERAGAQRLLRDARELGVVLAVGQEHGVAQHDGEVEVLELVHPADSSQTVSTQRVWRSSAP